MTVVDVIKYAFTAGVTYSCVRYAVSGEMKQDYLLFKGHNTKSWAEIIATNLLILAITLGLIVAVYVYGPAVFRWSWIMLFATKDDQGTNLNLAGTQIPFFGPIFMVLLLLNFPRLARYEEEEFRDGTKDWKDAIPRSIKFGLWHCLVGVPLCGGILLAIPGFWFTRQYFRGGVDRSTLYHSVYNMILGLVVLYFVTVSSIESLTSHKTPPPPKSSPQSLAPSK